MPHSLVIVLGDQLDRSGAAFDGFDRSGDRVWMAEVAQESTHVWTHKARIAVFLSAMRHFRDRLVAEGIEVDYTELAAAPQAGEPMTLAAALAASLDRSRKSGWRPERIVVVEPGEWRVQEMLHAAATAAGLPLEIRTDRHFFSSRDEFAEHARGRKQLRLEYFYRPLREKFGVLMDDDEPAGGQWNFDAENRGAFGKGGPGVLPAPVRFPPDAVSRGVIELVNVRFAGHPGSLTEFDWPVTPSEAQAALDDFLSHRLPLFGRYQDAIWTGEPWLYHSRLAQALNMKLLDPRGAEYVDRNALGADRPLPNLYWTGDTEMNCLRDAVGQTLKHGYAHHIQRLMVTGLFALLFGVDPRRVHEWYLAVYVDAVEWVELPNTLGMSQFADGGVMASKPYCASGAYLDRMSNACKGCRFDPKKATGPDACPFTTLYWDFLARHEKLLARNQRMTMQLKNLGRKPAADLRAIRRQADELRGQVS